MFLKKNKAGIKVGDIVEFTHEFIFDKLKYPRNYRTSEYEKGNQAFIVTGKVNDYNGEKVLSLISLVTSKYEHFNEGILTKNPLYIKRYKKSLKLYRFSDNFALAKHLKKSETYTYGSLYGEQYKQKVIEYLFCNFGIPIENRL